MATEVVKSIKAIGGDYTSLSAWEAGEQRDLVAADEIAVAECFNEWPTGLDDKVTISGWTTDASHYVEVRVPQGHRHDGVLKDNDGNYNGFTIIVTTLNSWGIAVYQDYTKIKHVAIDITHPSRGGGINLYTGATKTEAYSCLVNGSKYSGSFQAFKASPNSGKTHYFINCLSSNSEIGFSVGNRGNTYVYNCTSVDSSVKGFNISEDLPVNNVVIRNCLSKKIAGSDFVLSADKGGTHDVQYCASSDATADDFGGSGNRINQTFTFVDEAGDKFQPSKDDQGAKGHGIDLSSDSVYPFSDDIAGNNRTVPWDIGAWKAKSLIASKLKDRNSFFNSLIQTSGQ